MEKEVLTVMSKCACDRINEELIKKVCDAVRLSDNMFCLLPLEMVVQTIWEVCECISEGDPKTVLIRRKESTQSYLSSCVENALAKYLTDRRDYMYLIDAWFDPDADKDRIVRQVYHIMNDRFYKVLNRIGIKEITLLTAQTYERSIAKGKLVFALEDTYSSYISPEILPLSFETHTDILFREDDFRKIRKFLEGCKDNALLFTGNVGYNFRLRGYINQAQVDRIDPMLQIEIRGVHKWRFSFGKGILPVEIDYLSPKAPIDPVEDAFQNICATFGLKKEQALAFKSLLETLSKQSHGTSVLFFQGLDAKKRIKKLYEHNRAVCIKYPIEGVTDDAVRASLLAISRIDGAFAVNVKDKEITAFGVILDGDSTSPGNIGRGARFNTMNNFVFLCNKVTPHSALAMVISEDGSIETIPNVTEHL